MLRLAVVLSLLIVAPASACDPAPPVQTRIGVMANGIGNAAARTYTERSLAVQYARPNAALITATAPQAQNASSQAAGLKTVVTIANRGPGSGAVPPPTDLAAYANGVRNQIRLNRPDLVVIENEEIAPKFYSGTPQQYLQQLETAVGVAHEEGYRITNGGLVSQATALMTWDDLWRRGDHTAADTFALKAFGKKIVADLPNTSNSSKPILANSPKQRLLYDKAKVLVAGYKASRMDYVNFHWYLKDPFLLRQAIAYLERATGKPVVTNEIGQHDASPQTVLDVLGTLVDMRVPYAIWYAADGTNAKGLYDANRVLRPNGVAFREFAATHHFGKPYTLAKPCPARVAGVVKAKRSRRTVKVTLRCRGGGQDCRGSIKVAGRKRDYRVESGRRRTVTIRVARRGALRVRVVRHGGRTRTLHLRP